MRLLAIVPLLVGCNAAVSPHAADLGAAPAAVSTTGQLTTVTVEGPLKFAVFGDARPPQPDDTTGYPIKVVTGIFTLAQQMGAQFVVGTGDYMFATSQASVDGQLQQLLTAQGSFDGPVFHTMGNHECTGATDSNCPAFDETPNVKGFMAKLVPPGTPTPWYRVDVATPSGKAKFLFVAANAWISNQADWLKAQLADPTTYTFVVRHEPPGASSAPPGLAPSEQLVTAAPFTLELLGHSHTYRRMDSKRVISGNGGAEMRSYDHGSNYGFVLIEQQADGTLTGTEIDEATGMALDTWKITADGQPAS